MNDQRKIKNDQYPPNPPPQAFPLPPAKMQVAPRVPYLPLRGLAGHSISSFYRENQDRLAPLVCEQLRDLGAAPPSGIPLIPLTPYPPSARFYPPTPLVCGGREMAENWNDAGEWESLRRRQGASTVSGEGGKTLTFAHPSCSTGNVAPR